MQKRKILIYVNSTVSLNLVDIKKAHLHFIKKFKIIFFSAIDIEFANLFPDHEIGHTDNKLEGKTPF